MSFKRYTLTKNTTISTLGISGNSGASPILNIGGQYDSNKNKKYLYRILATIDTNSISSDIINGKIVDITTDSSSSAQLKMFNVLIGEENAYEFNINIFPLTGKPFSEGRGNKIDTFTQVGYANWLNASSTGTWSISGGDYIIDSNSASQYFETGYENLTANIKSMINNWLNGSSANYGLILKMDDTAELLTGSTTTNNQYYRKSLFSRHTNYQSKYPYVEIYWNGEIRDFRSLITLGNSANLYFYNIVNGVLTDIDSIATKFPGSVTISGATAGITSTTFSSITASLSASREKKGIYKINFTLPVSANVYNYFKDVWTITSSMSSLSSSVEQIFLKNSAVGANNSLNVTDIDIKLRDFKDDLYKNQIIYQRLYIKSNSQNNLIPLTASVTALNSLIAEDGYYKILINKTNEIYVDWQKLEFDSFGNFFIIDTDNYAKNVDYKIILKLNYMGQTFVKEFNKTFKII
jgi:hypothetical protein